MRHLERCTGPSGPIASISGWMFGATLAIAFVSVALADDLPVVRSPSPPLVAGTVARKDQVIFDLPKPIENPPGFNWYFRKLVPNGTPEPTRREHGAQQVMWEPLFLLDYSTGILEPWLANDEMVANAGQDEWTLTLRKDVKWSDGKPFSADDVIFTLDMVFDKRFDFRAALEADMLKRQVASYEKGKTRTGAVDPLKVIIKLREPNPRFALENFGASRSGSFLIMPKHVWQDILKIPDPEHPPDPAKFNPKPVGTGPYVFKEASKDRIVWERNKDWWGAKTGFKPLPKPLQVIWQVIDDEQASKRMLVANQIDAAREYTLENLKDAKSNNPKIVGWDTGSDLAWNEPCTRQLDINIKYLREPGGTLTPWSDPLLRQALSLLIDRTDLARTAYGDTVKPSRTMFVEYGASGAMMAKVIDKVVAAGFGLAMKADSAAAAQLLARAGYHRTGNFYEKGGEVLTTTILADSGAGRDSLAAVELAKQLTNAGIDAKAESHPHTEYWGRIVPKGSYEMAYGWLSCGSIAEPYTSMARYTADKAIPLGQISPGRDNTGRWDTQAAKDYSDVVKKIRDLPVADGSIPDLVKQAYQFLADEMPFVPLVQSPINVPFNTTYWKNWPGASTGKYMVPMHGWAATHRLIHNLDNAN